MSTIAPDVLAHLRASVWPALERAYGLPAGVLGAIAYWETRGRFDNQTSPMGARGVFQLRDIALEQVRRDSGFIVDPANVYQASVAAAVLLARYSRLFSGHAPLIVAAYNAGEGTIRRFMREVAQSGRGRLSMETKDYLYNVLPLIGA